MYPLQMLTKCPLTKCLLTKCPLAKRPLAKCPLAICPDTGGDTETPAGTRDSTRACGIGEIAPIVPLGAADFRTTVSAETPQVGYE